MNSWQPFNALIPASTMVNNIEKKKSILKMPIFSEDKLDLFENVIYYSFTNQDIITIKLFRNGKIYLKKGIVNYIDKLDKKIYLSDGYSFYFSQIVEIKKD